ncbi:YolD-like family protein [Alkalihalobacillus sp. LMS39]|uniref:YolD-like family protein n=1 Tax=Alkalihalobacillus sp. LMS39 TaxID=2924032 RepID=UPI001FB2653E|nr:YolD-like family protein [Alkalihalobacillus sp. LMS39]UOE96087.1 YolD-like family protein [Alkalihalobacillus sp. LMS39]
MNRDRGTMKWTAMMLPEHVAMMRELEKEYKKLPKPELDEQQAEEFERTICEAMEFNQALSFEFWDDGEHKRIVGKVHHIVSGTKELRVFDDEDERIFINFYYLINVKL